MGCAEEVAVTQADTVRLKVGDGVAEVKFGDVDPVKVGRFLRTGGGYAGKISQSLGDELGVGSQRRQ